MDKDKPNTHKVTLKDIKNDISITEHSKVLKIDSIMLKKSVFIKVYSKDGSYYNPSLQINDILSQEELKFINNNISKILFKMKQ